MTTKKPPLEKCIVEDLSTPPVHPEELLNNSTPDETIGKPPQTRLLLTGFEREEMTLNFLLGLYDLSEADELGLQDVSVGQP